MRLKLLCLALPLFSLGALAQTADPPSSGTAPIASVADAAPTLPTLQPGDDVVVSTGVTFDYVTHESASVSAISVKIGSIGKLPTYSTTTFTTGLYKPGAPQQQSSNALSAHSGITQIVAHPAKHLDLWVNSELGITRLDFATLGNFSGAVGFSYDFGARVTKDKYHVYLAPYLREVSIASLQVKPTYGIQIGTGFRKPPAD